MAEDKMYKLSDGVQVTQH